MDIINQVNSNLKNTLDPIFENKAMFSFISLFLVLYAGLVAPELPSSIAKLFQSKTFKLLVLIFIAYTATNNASIAIITSVCFVVSLQALSQSNKSIPAEKPVIDSETLEEDSESDIIDEEDSESDIIDEEDSEYIEEDSESDIIDEEENQYLEEVEEKEVKFEEDINYMEDHIPSSEQVEPQPEITEDQNLVQEYEVIQTTEEEPEKDEGIDFVWNVTPFADESFYGNF